MFDSLWDFWVFVLFFYGTLSKNDHAVPTCWPDQTKPQNLVLFHMELCCGPCYLLEQWVGLPGFSIPNILQGHHWLIFQENKGINLILGGSESGNLENSSFSMHWPYAFVIVRRQSQCFDALLIFKRMLTQAGRTNIAIYAPNLRYVLCTQKATILYTHGEWECLQSKFVNCCQTMSWKGWFDQVGSLVLFSRACRKSTTGFSHAPLKTAFSLHRRKTPRGPRGCFNSLS